jgi:hypothetical protein
VWLEPITNGYAFESPVDLTTFPGEPDKMIVVQKYGKIFLFDKKDPRPHLMLDISDRVYAGGEEGLLSIAIDPENTDTAYIYYCLEKPFRNCLSRVRLREDRTLDIETEHFSSCHADDIDKISPSASSTARCSFIQVRLFE